MRTKKNNFQKTFLAVCLTLLAVSGVRSEPRIDNQQGNEGKTTTNLAQAKEALSNGKYDEAIALYKKEIKENPENAEAYYDLGTTYMLLQQNDQALQWMRKAIEINPGDGEFYWGAGSLIAFQGNYKDALTHFEKAAALNFPDAYVGIAGCYDALGMKNESEKYMSEALKITKDKEKTRTLFKAFQKAQEEARIKKNPQASTPPPQAKEEGDKASYYHTKGLDYFNAGQYEDAIEMWKKEIEAGPKNPSWPYFDIGLCYSNLKRYDEAVPYFKKSLELGFPAARVHRNLAHAYFNMGDIKETEQSLIEALKLNPSDTTTLENIDYYKQRGAAFPNITAELMQKLKEEHKKKREERIQKIKEVEKETQASIQEPFYITYFKEIAFAFGALVLLSILYFKPWYSYYLYAADKHFKAGRHRDAEEIYEKLFEFRKGKLIPYGRLKEVYLKLGRRHEKAVLVFEKLYKENPDDREVIAALAGAYAEKMK